jgi:hypothetical protein
MILNHRKFLNFYSTSNIFLLIIELIAMFLIQLMIALIAINIIIKSFFLIKLTIAIIFAVTITNAITKVRDNIYEWVM